MLEGGRAIIVAVNPHHPFHYQPQLLQQLGRRGRTLVPAFVDHAGQP
jgi:hypothetical protein